MIEKEMLAAIRRADYQFNLIDDGDVIAIGVSGGKDSLTLLKLLKIYQKYPFKKFDFFGVFLDLGFGGNSAEKLKTFGEENDIKIYIEDNSQVFPILQAHTKNNMLPCSICSRMKKAGINRAAHKYGCSKVAFAHHADDAIETVFLNEIYGGRVATFAPKMFLSNEKITFIRPLIYVREAQIKQYAEETKMDIIKSGCPNDKFTKREDIKNLLASIYQTYPTAYHNFLKMLTNVDQFDLWFEDLKPSLGDGIIVKKVLTKEDMLDMVNVRSSVFGAELGVAMSDILDETDYSATHYLIYKNELPVGALRYYIDEDGTYHIGRLCLKKEYRSFGLSQRLVKDVEQIISQISVPTNIVINCKSYLKKFYLNLGYLTNGVEFGDGENKNLIFTKTMDKPIFKQK